MSTALPFAGREVAAKSITRPAAQPSPLRRNLAVITRDGIACSVMVGLGESYFAAFALALGTGELVAGLITTLPLLAGSVLQLVTPVAVERLGSYRRWVVGCVLVQALSFLPMAIGAIVGRMSVTMLLALAALYWGAGMASGPAWNAWVDTLLPERFRSRYFGCRSRVTQAATLLGFVAGGAWLQWGEAGGQALLAFAILFAVALGFRLASAHYLTRQSEPVRPAGNRRKTIVNDLLSPLRRADERKLLVYLWAMQGSAQIAAPYFAPLMLAQLKFEYWRYMLVLAISMTMKAVALPTVGRVAARTGARRLLQLGGVLVIPLPLLWVFCTATPYLIGIQCISGIAWSTYELAAVLIFFEDVRPERRLAVLTLYNLGFAAATVVGSLIGGTLLELGGGMLGYTALLCASCFARICILPLAPKLGREEDIAASHVAPTILPLPVPAADIEEMSANQAA